MEDGESEVNDLIRMVCCSMKSFVSVLICEVQRSLVPFPTASKKPESTFSKEKEFENHTLASTLKLNGTPQHNTAIKFLSRKEHLKSAKSKVSK